MKEVRQVRGTIVREATGYRFSSIEATANDRSGIFSRLGRIRLALLVCPLVLTACGPTLDTQKVEQTIQDGIIKQGGVSLKSVMCPERVKPATGTTFECYGELDTGKAVAIPVKQLDEQGTVQWNVPSVKGLLNLVQLETVVQTTIDGETGLQPKIDCGAVYRAAKPGETFECQVVKQPVKRVTTKKVEKTPAAKKGAKPEPEKKQPDSILISIDSDGNINWQQVFRTPVAVASARGTASTSVKTAKANTAPTAKEPSPDVASPAEEFLNKPGAIDTFD